MSLLDAVDYTRWFNDKENIRFMSAQDCPSFKKEQKKLKEILKNKNRFVFTIVLESKNIGFCSTNINFKSNCVNIGLMIGEKKEWNKGYGQEALRAVINYLFKEMRMNRVEICVYKNNKRAVNVYKKIGFKKEGLKRQSHWNFVTNKYDDEIIMSILRKEWKSK